MREINSEEAAFVAGGFSLIIVNGKNGAGGAGGAPGTITNVSINGYSSGFPGAIGGTGTGIFNPGGSTYNYGRGATGLTPV